MKPATAQTRWFPILTGAVLLVMSIGCGVPRGTLPSPQPERQPVGGGGSPGGNGGGAMLSSGGSGGVSALPTGSGGSGGSPAGGMEVGTPPAGECTAGQLRCSPLGPAVEICTPAGVWTLKEVCSATCSDGACAGACKPNERRCGTEQTPETCNDRGEWTPAPEPCPNVCSGLGTCTGDCKPGAKRCGGDGGLIPETCDDNGKWIAAAPCLNLCSSGSCGGSCMPGSKRCGAGGVAESCSAMGTWEPGTRCPFVCRGAGECAGECRPGAAKRCSPDGSSVQSCNAEGGWAGGDSCPNGCSNGACQTCRPGSKTCQGKLLRTCNARGSGYDDRTCGVTCDGGSLSCIDCAPQPEICDGKDNDCNGAVDDNVPDRACSPACAGPQRCVAGGKGTWNPASCRAPTDVTCCGSQGLRCTGAPAGGTPSCEAGSCGYRCSDQTKKACNGGCFECCRAGDVCGNGKRCSTSFACTEPLCDPATQRQCGNTCKPKTECCANCGGWACFPESNTCAVPLAGGVWRHYVACQTPNGNSNTFSQAGGRNFTVHVTWAPGTTGPATFAGHYTSPNTVSVPGIGATGTIANGGTRIVWNEGAHCWYK